MGVHTIKMPDIGEGIAEVEVVAWHVQPGDAVAEDQLLAEVMTDKATVEIPSPVAGKVLALGGKVGELMAVGGPLVRIEVEGAGNEKAAARASTSTSTPAASAETTAGTSSPSGSVPAAAVPSASVPAAARSSASPTAPPSSPSTSAAAAPRGDEPSINAPGPDDDEPASASNSSASSSTHQPGPSRAPSPAPRLAARQIGPSASAPFARAPGEKPLASPAVRRRAWDMGIELQFVRGSGEAGVILHEDLDTYLALDDTAPLATARPLARYEINEKEEEVPIIGLRRRIAQKMQEAKRRIPHYSYVEEVDVTELEAFRTTLNQRWGDTRGKLTVLPLLLRALVLAVAQHPQINARFDDEAGIVTRFGAVHAGIATQTPAGLMVPVLRHAETHDLWSAAAEISRLADAARTAKAAREELSGSTITITSLGALGGIVTTPVINHPEVAIVGVNRIVERPVVRDGAIVIRKIMNLSSSFDHRVVDGADAAAFIQRIRALLETPALLFINA